MTDSGAMRQVVKILEPTTARSPSGAPLKDWVEVATRRAEKTATPGAEIWSSNERSGRIPTVFKIRWPRTFKVSPKMRLEHRGRVFDIVSAIDPDGREVDMLISCLELVGDSNA